MKNILKQIQSLIYISRTAKFFVIGVFLFGVCIFYLFQSFSLKNEEKILLETQKKYQENYQELLLLNKQIEKLEKVRDKRELFNDCLEEQFDRIKNHLPLTEGYCERRLEQQLEQSNSIGFIEYIIPQASANNDEEIFYKNLKITGFKKKPPFKLYSRLKDECIKQNVKNPKHCIKIGLSIAYAESSWKDLHTPFGLQSKDKGFKKWVSSYKKYWYKAQDGSFFYGKNGKAGKSHYCLSEESSGSQGWCPNGQKNFNKIYKNIFL